MQLLRLIPVNKVCAMLCIALTLAFAGTSFSSTMDRIQHAPGASPVHEHLIFSDISLADAHDVEREEDHHSPDAGHEDQNEPESSDRLAGGHHHHGDTGSGLIVLASADMAAISLLGDAPSLSPDRPPPSFRISGHDRPPKHLTISA
ncbi:hypothetical protein [Sphingobium boeckii]|uniref:Uncharacterized protein n=1 Tax=Sphingobium boeckii TaxID=1082345 RepID=A0A7W9EDH9_9SPHN|nr:hypothetical protein [Sphingobium boeckii]MBB5684949.1 hypothetical protein [Sphingobium boeckii]